MLTVISAYNEARLLPMCLGHLPPHRVIVVDGAYADFPHTVPFSDDGTCEIAERWGAEVVRVTRPWTDQPEKRTACLIPGETVFLLDADEWLHTPLFPLPEGADVGWVTVTSPIYAEPYLEPRVFRVREGFHCSGRHHWIYDGDGRLVASHRKRGEDYSHVVLPVVIENARNWREGARDAAKQTYAFARNKDERRFRDEGSSVVPHPS